MPRPGVTFRPRVEALEAREVPAGVTYVWTNDGGDGLFSNPDNWLDGGDKPAWAPPSGFADFLVFDGAVTSAPCVGLTGSYESIFILNFSTIDLGGGVQTKFLDLDGGEIRNTADGQAITVTQELNWTQGAVNSSTYSGALNLDGSAALDGVAGATALIAPAGGGTVELGSHLNLENGAIATMKEGTIDATNDGTQFVISTGSSFDINPSPLVNAALGLTRPIELIIARSGQQFSRLIIRNDVNILGKVTNAGSVTLMPNAALNLTGMTGDDVAYWQGFGPGGAGNTYLFGGSFLTTGSDKKIQITGGILATMSDDPFGNGNCDALIMTSMLEVSGGDIYINYDAFAHISYGQLGVIGKMNWTGGTFNPYVEGNVDWGNSDKLVVSSTFTISGGNVIPVSIGANFLEVEPTTGNSWLIFENAALGITGMPSYNSNDWIIGTDGGNPVHQYFLTAW